METIRWLPDPNINFSIGIDGIPSFFVVSTTFPIPICTPVGWSSIESSEKEYTIAFSIRESIMIAVPRMPDPSPPHVFSESVLISMSCGAERHSRKKQESSRSPSLVCKHLDRRAWGYIPRLLRYCMDTQEEVLPAEGH